MQQLSRSKGAYADKNTSSALLEGYSSAKSPRSPRNAQGALDDVNSFGSPLAEDSSVGEIGSDEADCSFHGAIKDS
jgi:hypothetical protein